MLFKNYNKIISNGKTPILQKKRKDILDIYTSAVESVNPYNCVKRLFKEKKIRVNDNCFNLTDYENIFVIGFGKASIGMTQAVCNSTSIKKGVVITNNPKFKLPCKQIDVFVGEHPIPGNGSIIGTKKIIDFVNQCKKNDLLIVVISGGGSALLCKPRISLPYIQATTDLLLKSGADIKEINTVRKHLSYVKGGQLAKLSKAPILSLIISDIVDDPLEFISSGPTYSDSTTYYDVKNILNKYNILKTVPKEVTHIVDDGINGKIQETPNKNDPIFKNVYNYIVANNKIACENAFKKAKELGYNAEITTMRLTGEARTVGSKLLENIKSHTKNTIFISGGETTVTIVGNGKGGRNQELVLGTVEKIAQSDMIIASFATDGIDGTSDAAGAIADGFTLLRAKEKKLNPNEYLNKNNSYEFFRKINDFFSTGSTGTNVMDIQLIIN